MREIFALLGAVAAGPLLTWLMVTILNRMPAKCFCDYNETPTQQHAAPRVSHIAALLCAGCLSLVCILLLGRFYITLESISLALLTAVLLMIALSDIRYCIIPDELILAGALLAGFSVVGGLFHQTGLLDWFSPILGAAIGAGIILIFNLVGRIVYKKDALGMGDLKLMAVCGLACGHAGILLSLFIGIIAAALFFAVAMVAKKIKSGQYMPLGPFLVFGTVTFFCFEESIYSFINWYISLF